ncbi:hypothetical protein AB2L28_17320 [Kineococcus sp. TBRC 1896]|uniref:Aminoglycoside phosphotransferase family protein n=1 Tax=Kineococcus mangrovi TaxID=1660183 RepID=A0ABV4I5N6_9ACTN
MEPLTAAASVRAVRAVLRVQGVVGEESWRTTVAPADGGTWTVRTWIGVGSPGPPDHVHRVHPPSGAGEAPRVEQVFPVRAPRRTRVSRHLDYFAPGTLHDPPPWPAREDLPPRSD